MNERDPDSKARGGPTRAATKGLQNKVVRWLLRSPLHFLLSRSVCLVEYQGRATGRRIATPTQYARRPLLATYFRRFPKAARSLTSDVADQQTDRAVVVLAGPR